MAPPKKKKEYGAFASWDSTPKTESKPRVSSETPRTGAAASSITSKDSSRRSLPGTLGTLAASRKRDGPAITPKTAPSSRPPPRPGQKYPNINLQDKNKHSSSLTPAQRIKRIKGVYWISGIGVYALTAYGVYLYIQYNKAVDINKDNERQYSLGLKKRPDAVDTNQVYERISENYDSNVRFSEWFMGMSLLRRWMLWGLQGDILEASAGTGRNNPYYHVGKCKSITMVDNSPKMLEIAKSDFEKRHPEYGHISFAAQDASQPINSPSGEGFDQVIQTMGLCSQKSPVETLRNLERHCKPDGTLGDCSRRVDWW
ncbi:hypothetical protein AA313_de0202512 [Arthrobotrys entomopaga]|nr:hypothetical protein AA313_de0202512 [Arthrobotrys entomopaga]